MFSSLACFQRWLVLRNVSRVGECSCARGCFVQTSGVGARRLGLVQVLYVGLYVKGALRLERCGDAIWVRRSANDPAHKRSCRLNAHSYFLTTQNARPFECTERFHFAQDDCFASENEVVFLYDACCIVIRTRHSSRACASGTGDTAQRGFLLLRRV